jgi:hypothetical protein
MNYEEELVAQFGESYSIADMVHIPVSLSTFSREGVARLVAAQEALPRRLKDFFVNYRGAVTEEIREDKRFEFRVELVQKRAPMSDADLAVSFVREEDLSEDVRNAYQELERLGRVIIREKERPIANLGRLRPKPFSAAVEARIPFRFRPFSEFPQAWKTLLVRPPSSAKGKTRRTTDERYCIYDDAHDDYVYLPAFLELLVERCSTREGFLAVVGREPVMKDGS